MSKSVFRALFLAINLFVAVGLANSVYDLWKRRDIVRQRAAVLNRVKDENRQLKEDLAEAQTPEFIEREARNRLNLAKPGESIVIMETPPAATQSAQVETTQVPTWRAWWRLFF